MKSKIYSISDNEFISIVKRHNTKSDILKELGYISYSSCYPILNKRLDELDLSKDLQKRYNLHISKVRKIYRTGKSTSKILETHLKKSNFKMTSALRRKIISSNILGEYKCSNAKCTVSNTWIDEKIILQIDHINGDPYDHRKENLRYLCPNCHSQTKTFGRKIRKEPLCKN